MINIINKKDCVGCHACVQRCPVQCIYMYEDEQGFLYPKADVERCINCGICEKVCPVINQAEPQKPVHTYAAWNSDDSVRMSSSSGGIFFALAKKIIDEGGVVFGAKFNEKWDVVHDYAETIESIKEFQGSKYVQSKIDDSFKHAEKFLKEGRKVMFTGTPCQLAALRLFLRKDYDGQLLKVDVACHSVPSPKIWRAYLDTKRTYNFDSIVFRDKRNGWNDYNFTLLRDNKAVFTEKASVNPYMQGFVKDLFIRPSCLECPSKCGKSHSDLTIADYWGIRKYYPRLNSHKGISLILVKSATGESIMNSINIQKIETLYKEALSGNASLEQNAIRPKNYYAFWKDYTANGFVVVPIYLRELRPSIFKHSYFLMKRLTGKFMKIINNSDTKH